MPYRVVELSLSKKAMLLTSQGTAVHACMYVYTHFCIIINVHSNVYAHISDVACWLVVCEVYDVCEVCA